MTTKNLAYLDAGSAAMVIQMLVGALAAAAVSVKVFWRRILHLLRPHKKSDLEP
jgi:hypothetical protein